MLTMKVVAQLLRLSQNQVQLRLNRYKALRLDDGPHKMQEMKERRAHAKLLTQQETLVEMA